MSYNISLIDPATDAPCQVPFHQEGGVYAIYPDGNAPDTVDADLNITYNYSSRFQEAFDGPTLREWIDGKRAADAIPGLDRAIRALGTMRDDDYWAPTSGNAGWVCYVLRWWAELYPDAVFRYRP